MISLGIEGTAHTLGIGICTKDEVLSDTRYTHAPEKGIHPRESARFMGRNLRKAVDEALDEASLRIGDIDLFAYSQGPGLGPCLRTVSTAARALALHNKRPLVGVNHCVSHVEIGRWACKMKRPLVLYVSGGNTQILRLEDRRYRVFGETLDIGIGNMLDKFGRYLGMNHPAGPGIERLALKGNNFIEMPYVVKGTDLSFSGILTNAKQQYDSGHGREDVCFSLQETVFSMLTEVTERALSHLCANEVLLVGGVAANMRLREMLKLMAKEHGARFCVPDGYCADNGVMIAYTGLLMHEAGIETKLENSEARQRYRTDEVEVVWDI